MNSADCRGFFSDLFFGCLRRSFNYITRESREKCTLTALRALWLYIQKYCFALEKSYNSVDRLHNKLHNAYYNRCFLPHVERGIDGKILHTLHGAHTSFAGRMRASARVSFCVPVLVSCVRTKVIPFKSRLQNNVPTRRQSLSARIRRANPNAARLI